MIFTQLVQANLSTKTIGRKIEYYQVLESTNTEAWELIQDSAAHGTVVITDNQTAGKGRGAKAWASSPDRSLTFSIILKHDNILNPSLVPLAAGIAVAKAMEPFGIRAELKWPNDIMIEGKKTGGILCESKYRGELLTAMVIGIGMNVNEEAEDFSDALSEIAASMFIVSGVRQQRERVLAECLNSLENCLMESDETVIRNWTELCGHIGKNISFTVDGKTTEGKFIGLNSAGTAVIESNGEQTEFTSPLLSIKN